MTPTPQFEEEIRAAVAVPQAREEFVNSLHARLVQKATSRSKLNRPIFRRPAWVVTFVIAALIIGILAIGPQRVFAAVRGLFGYIPGVGIVDQSAPIRVLAEPVSVTRDEISITVTSATLTGDKTHIEYRIFGVPGSAYPDREDVIGCSKQPYLRLADGTLLSQIDNDFQPLPANVNEAVLVIPCILNTLPGKVPENWGLSLRFVPAPPGLTVMPVFELSPSPLASQTPGSTALPENAGPTPVMNVNNTLAAPVDSAVTVSKVIETSDGYILIGQFQPQSQPGEWTEMVGEPEIQDASGKKVNHTYPMDVNVEMGNTRPGTNGWAMQFKAAGLVYPLTITFSGVSISQPNPGATAEFTFDAGLNPQPGQEWTPNQEIQLAGHTLKVASISVDSRNGYSFMFQVDPKVYSASVQIVGHTPSGGGGGGGGGLTDGEFNVSLSFTQLPTGVLTVTLSNLAVIGDTINWQGQWFPAVPRTDLPANPTQPPGLCLTSDTLTQLKPIPSALSKGKALVYEELGDTGKWGLVLYTLDGSHKEVVVPNGNWGALSPDGSKVAYSATDNGIHLVDVDLKTDQVLQNASGFDINWSPDGTQIAYVGTGNGAINSAFVVKADGAQVHQISDWSYEAIIGWSPDGAQLYFVAPFTGGAAWKVYSYNIASGTAQERFTIENGTPKFLNPKLSPDGNWIAYRGRDNSSLYLVHPDGSDMHLILDNVGAVGVEWSRAGWLGVSLGNPNSSETTVVLLKPDGCEAYLLPFVLHGDLEGLFTP
jgi:Tol biopolymer transport system component